jgi:GTP-binding protein Era
MAVLKKEDRQVLIYDTPGISNITKNSVQTFNKIALSTLKLVDYVIFMFSPDKKITDDILQIAKRTENRIAIINKIDARKRSNLLEFINHLKDYFSEIYMVSSKTLDGIENLKDELFKICDAKGENYTEFDKVTNRNMESLFNDATREVIFNAMNEEVPYNIQVDTTDVEERDVDIVIRQNLHIKKAYRHMFLSKIKDLSILSREKIQSFIEKKVHLFLNCVA